MINKNRSKGFTLIELLVATAIIAIMALIGYAIYTRAQIVARDSHRKQDLKIIQTALELYYEDHKMYPRTDGYIFGGCGNTNWIDDKVTLEKLAPKYLLEVPEEKLCGWSGYVYISSDNYPGGSPGCPASGTWYVLKALLENQNDPQTVANEQTKICGGIDPPSSANPYYLVHNPD